MLTVQELRVVVYRGVVLDTIDDDGRKHDERGRFARKDGGVADAPVGGKDWRKVKPVLLKLSGWVGTRAKLREQAVNWYRSNLQGHAVANDDMGVQVQFSAEGRGVAFATSGNLRDGWRAEMVKALPDLVKRAVKIGDALPDDDRRNDTKRFHTLAAPLEIEGKVWVAKITVREALRDHPGKHHKFYDITALEIKDAPVLSGAVLPANGERPLHPTGTEASSQSVGERRAHDKGHDNGD